MLGRHDGLHRPRRQPEGGTSHRTQGGDGKAEQIVFSGTVLVFLAHIPITFFGKDESLVFLIILGITPFVTLASWFFYKTRKNKQVVHG